MDNFTVRIGFLGLYRVSVTDWCRQAFDENLKVLQGIEGMELVVPKADRDDPHNRCTEHGMVGNLDEAEAAAEYLKSQKVDGLILCPLDFGDERAASKAAELLRVPILLYAGKEPPAQDEASLARKSDSYCGNLTIAAGLRRRQIPFYFSGIFSPADEEFLATVQAFARAVAVVKGVRGARLGQIGLRPEGFESVAYCEGAMVRDFGQNIIPRNLSEITAQARGYADDDPNVAAIINEIESQYANITISSDSLRTAAKLELAMKQFWRENRLSGQAMQCWGPAVRRQLGITPCVVFGRLTQSHMLTACEADVLGALAMLVTHRAALGHRPPHLIDWTIQHREDPNRLLAWHCGNAPPGLAKPDAPRSLRSRKDMMGELPIAEEDPMAGLGQFQLRPGKVTFCRLEYYEEGWKMLIADGEIKASDEVMSGTWSWVEVSDHRLLYHTLVEEGFVHHASMIHGDFAQALQLACKFLNIRPVVINQD